jgi:hypothetical protein
MERWHLPLLGRRDIPAKLSSVELREFFSFTDEKLLRSSGVAAD